MIQDAYNLFVENMDLDQETGTFLATNQIDLGAGGRQIGHGQPMWLVMTVDETFTDGGDAATLTIKLVSDDTASIHATTRTEHLSSPPMVKANLVAGDMYGWPVPPGNPVYERYLGVQAVVGTAGFDAGEVTLALMLDPPPLMKHYPDASN